MKKSKSGGAQTFLIQHAEKLVFAGLVLVVLLCISSAIQRETYQRQPDELAKARQQKADIIENNSPESFQDTKDVKVVDYEKEVENSQRPVPEGWARPIAAIGVGKGVYSKRRGQPEYLAVQDVNAAYKSVIFAEKSTEVAKAGGAANGGFGKINGANIGANNDAVPPGQKPGRRGGKKPRGIDDIDGAGQVGERGGIPAPPGFGKVPSPFGNKLGGNVDDPAHAQKKRPGVTPPQGSVPRGYQTVVITARVPRKAQTEIFQEAFELCAKRDPSYVEYVTFLLERKDESEPGWKPVVEDNLKLMTKWATTHPEIVDSRLTRPLVYNASGSPRWTEFTFPLGPILNQDWGDEVIGGFAVARRADEAQPGGPGGPFPGDVPGDVLPPGVAPPPGGQPGEVPPGVAPPPGGVPPGVAPPPGAGPRRGAARPGRRFAQFPVDSRGEVAPGVPPGGAKGPFPGGPMDHAGDKIEGNWPGGADGRGADGMVAIDPNADFLFRFFDFTVEEGHRYRYRVTLYIKNPNYGIAPRFLEDPELATAPYATTKPVESPVVSVSGFSEVLSGPVRSATASNQVSASVVIQQRDPLTGAQVSREFTGVERGARMNYHVTSEDGPLLLVDPITGLPRQIPEFTFTTRELALDIKGGDRLWKNGRRTSLRSPGEMLVIDANGVLQVRNELSEEGKSAFDKETARLTELDKGGTQQPQDGGINKPFGDLLEGGGGIDQLDPGKRPRRRRDR